MKFNNFAKISNALSLKKLSIALIVVIILIGIFYLFNINQEKKDDTMLLVHTINKLQKDIQGIQVQNKTQSNAELQGKIEPELIQEFRDDEQFLQEMVKLKKEKLLYQLSIEVEGLKRQRDKANEVMSTPQPMQPMNMPQESMVPSVPQRPRIELALANESNQSAVVTIDGGNPITLKIGNVVSNYKLINVTRNYIQVEDLVLNTIESIYIR